MSDLRPKFIPEPEMSFYQLGAAWVFRARLEEADVSATAYPTSATITITHAGDGALTTPISGAAMTVTDEVISYTVAAGNITIPEADMKIVIDLVDGDGVTWPDYLHLFDAVRFTPHMSIGFAEVVVGIPGFSKMGTTPEDSDGSGMLREAWEDVLELVKAHVRYPALAVNANDLRRGHVFRARELYSIRNIGESGDRADVMAEKWGAEFERWRKQLKLTVDADDSGTVESDERGLGLAVRWAGRRFKT